MKTDDLFTLSSRGPKLPGHLNCPDGQPDDDHNSILIRSHHFTNRFVALEKLSGEEVTGNKRIVHHVFAASVLNQLAGGVVGRVPEVWTLIVVDKWPVKSRSLTQNHFSITIPSISTRPNLPVVTRAILDSPLRHLWHHYAISVVQKPGKGEKNQTFLGGSMKQRLHLQVSIAGAVIWPSPISSPPTKGNR